MKSAANVAGPVGDLVELVSEVASEHEDAVTFALMDAGLGALGFEIRDQGSFKRSSPGRVEFVFYSPEAELAALKIQLDSLLAPFGADRLVWTKPAPEAAWRDKWKEYFKVVHVTDRLVIVPSWEKYEAKPNEVLLNLDPGRAFGTGQHESTRLCMKAVDALAQRGVVGKKVLDVGCGSGILTVAALKLWPQATALMCDIDIDSVRVAVENIEQNGLEKRVRATSKSIDKTTGQFDVVFANIQLDVLELLAPELVRLTARGGVLILAGLLAGQELVLEKRLCGPGKPFDVWGRGFEGEWTSLSLFRAAD